MFKAYRERSVLVWLALAGVVSGCPIYGTGSNSSDPVCHTNGDCDIESYCVSGVCTVSKDCDSDAFCPTSFYCDYRHTCVPTVTGYCRNDSECASTEQCIEARCRTKTGLCQFNYQCGAARGCVNSECAALCTKDSDCGSGTTCQSGFCRAPAVAECDVSRSCDGDGHCVDGRCLPRCKGSNDCESSKDVCGEDGFCRADWQPHPTCTGNSDCQSGHVCVAGTCRTPCATGANDECRAFDVQIPICASDHLCYSSNETNPECRAAVDCTGGLACIDAQCR